MSGAVYEVSVRIRPVLQMRKLRCGKIRGCVGRGVLGGVGLSFAIG